MELMLNDRCATMPWDAIDNVVFDVGNVLLGFQPKALLRAILPDHEADYPVLLRRVFHSPYWPMLDRGVIGAEEAVMLMSSRHSEFRPQIERIMREWNAHLPLIEEGVKTLQACKDHGKNCYVLTNYAAGPFDESCARFPEVFSLIDGFVVSGRLGMIKPEPRIYKHLLSRFITSPERTLFIDDSPINIEAAMMWGMQGLCYNEPGMLHRFFQLDR